MGRLPSHTLSMGTKWPLTGGVPPEVSYEDYEVEKIFIAGYQDGSVRIWDATYPVLVLMFVLEGKVCGLSLLSTRTCDITCPELIVSPSFVKFFNFVI